MAKGLEGWQRPRREDQLDLFMRPTEEILALACVPPDDLARWKALRWLSAETATAARMHESEVWELCFIRNLARSGLSDTQVADLLAELPKPYRYDPIRTAYSFALGWVQRPPIPTSDEVDGFIRKHIEEWIRSTAYDNPEDGALEHVVSVIRRARGVAQARREREEDEECPPAEHQEEPAAPSPPAHTSVPATTTAEAALLRFAEEFGLSVARRAEQAVLPQWMDEYSFACLLVAEEHRGHLGQPSLQALQECRAAAEGRADIPWADVLPWDLALEALGERSGDPDRGLECLIANLGHHDSSIRRFIAKMAWFVRHRLPVPKAAPALLKNSADTIDWPLSFGLCRALFEDEATFWQYAESYQPPARFEEQYRERLRWAKDEGGRYATQWELLDLEARVRAHITRYVLGLASAR